MRRSCGPHSRHAAQRHTPCAHHIRPLRQCGSTSPARRTARSAKPPADCDADHICASNSPSRSRRRLRKARVQTHGYRPASKPAAAACGSQNPCSPRPRQQPPDRPTSRDSPADPAPERHRLPGRSNPPPRAAGRSPPRPSTHAQRPTPGPCEAPPPPGLAHQPSRPPAPTRVGPGAAGNPHPSSEPLITCRAEPGRPRSATRSPAAPPRTVSISWDFRGDPCAAPPATLPHPRQPPGPLRR